MLSIYENVTLISKLFGINRKMLLRKQKLSLIVDSNSRAKQKHWFIWLKKKKEKKITK